MIKIDVTPLQEALLRKERLEKDLQERDEAFLEKIDKAVSESDAENLQAKRDQLRKTYEPFLESAQNEIRKAEEYVRVQKDLIQEKEKAYEETLKAKVKANLSLANISDEKFEELWSTIRDRMIVEKAISGDKSNQSRKKLTL